MYGMYGNIYHQYTPNVRVYIFMYMYIYIYTIHTDPSWVMFQHRTMDFLGILRRKRSVALLPKST